MELIRILHANHFDRRKKRFTSLAFKNSSNNGGISVFDKQCALETGSTACQHIGRFYEQITDGQPIFWEFSSERLFASATLEQQDSNTGDVCHYNIKNLTDKDAKKTFIQEQSNSFFGINTCNREDGSHRQFTLQDIIDHGL